jgi:hypothetical protein
MLFRNVNQVELEDIRLFFREESIDISINYPDKDLVIPSIVILLKNELAREDLLGDFQQGPSDWNQLGYPLPEAELLGDQTILGSGSRSTTAYAGNLLMEPVTAIAVDSTSITAPEGTTTLIDPYEETAFVVTMEGTGAGQRRQVTSITPSLIGQGVDIEIATAWTTLPDTTTVFKIVGEPDPGIAPDRQGATMRGYTGEPARMYSSGDMIERYGAIFESNYQLDIRAASPEGVIYLYNVVRALFYASRNYLIKQGFLNLGIAGSDIAPSTDYYPGLVYGRSLTVTFQNAFDVFLEIEEPLASTIQVALDVHHPDVLDPNDVTREVLQTEFDIP